MMFLLLGRSRKMLLQPASVLYKYKKVFLVIISSKLASGEVITVHLLVSHRGSNPSRYLSCISFSFFPAKLNFCN
jgi:hypothetical protein